MRLEVKAWDQLSRKEINDIFSLRSEVFVVEQECIYQDIDGKDRKGRPRIANYQQSTCWLH
jgi:ElaA protein